MDSENFKTFIKVMENIKESFNLSEVPYLTWIYLKFLAYLICSKSALKNFYLSQ